MPAAAIVLIIGLAQPEMIDRTLAIVGGQAITLSDVRAALAVGLIEKPSAADPIPAATRTLIERLLILREVERYAPPEPPETAVDKRVRVIAARFADEESFRAALVSSALSESQLRAWARDDLRMTAYLDQRFTDPDKRADLIADWLADLRRRTPVVELVKN
jgi:hypothetical protein